MAFVCGRSLREPPQPDPAARVQVSVLRLLAHDERATARTGEPDFGVTAAHPQLFPDPAPCPACHATTKDACVYEQVQQLKGDGDLPYLTRPSRCPYAYDPATAEIGY